VLPGEHPGEAEGMAVETFARGAADTGAKLVYLSSCKGSSANTVASLAQRSVPYGLGFRWDVDDEGAAEFAALFYDELFGPSSATICDAFRTACCAVYPPKQIEASTDLGFSDPSFAVRRLDDPTCTITNLGGTMSETRGAI